MADTSALLGVDGLTAAGVGNAVVLEEGPKEALFATEALSEAEEVVDLSRAAPLSPRLLRRGMGPFASTEEVRRRLEATLKSSREIVARRNEGVRSTSKQLGFDGHLYDIKSYGVPRDAKLVVIGNKTHLSPEDPSDTIVLGAETVFRQYVGENSLEPIIRNEVLVPGPLPFSYGGGGYYVDLIGAFLTLPIFKAAEVGVDPFLSPFYVDLILHPGTGLVYFPEGRQFGKYFMIPGIPKQRDWYIEYYNRWVRAGMPSREEIAKRSAKAKDRAGATNLSGLLSCVEEFQETAAEGGFPKPSRIPITVVGSGNVPPRR